jgi:multiple sugar transport system substrate-binding protein
MLWTGRWPLKDFLKNQQLNFGTAQLPMGKERANSICWAGFGMYSKGTNKDTAWAFLKYITAEEGAQEFAKYAFTAVQPIAALQGLDSDPFNTNIVKDLANVKPLPDTRQPKWVDCGEKFFKEELEKVFLEDKAVQDAMDTAASEADACFKQ